MLVTIRCGQCGHEGEMFLGAKLVTCDECNLTTPGPGVARV